MKSQSIYTTVATKLGLHKLRWCLRHLNVPISNTDLVLEVGSGGTPYPRANVLWDAYEETREQHWEALVHDRPAILSFGENLPFKDKIFDYVIAAHVLEHTLYPEKFLAELQYVAKVSYIETSDVFMERINPYKDHCLKVTVRDKGWLFVKKTAWIYDADLVELYEKRARSIITRETIPQHATEFHVHYFWQDHINYSIVNQEADAAWQPPLSSFDTPQKKIGIKPNEDCLYSI